MYGPNSLQVIFHCILRVILYFSAPSSAIESVIKRGARFAYCLLLAGRYRILRFGLTHFLCQVSMVLVCRNCATI